nr:unnamed protein product [Callosobruchus analis]
MTSESWLQRTEYPTAVFCIIATEFCERFSFCGLRTILSLYLRNILLFSENTSTVVYHVFIMCCYIIPLVGAVLADSYFGRYKTIRNFSLIYLVGNILMCIAAVPTLDVAPIWNWRYQALCGSFWSRAVRSAFPEGTAVTILFSILFCHQLGRFCWNGTHTGYEEGSYLLWRRHLLCCRVWVSCGTYGAVVTQKSREKGEIGRSHWLDYAKGRFSGKTIEDMKIASHMNGYVLGTQIVPDQMQVVNPAIVLILIPVFDRVLYPCCSKLNVLEILELALETTYPELPAKHHASMNVMNTLPCSLTIQNPFHEVQTVRCGELHKFAEIPAHNYSRYTLSVEAPLQCGTIRFNRRTFKLDVVSLENQIDSVLIGTNANNEIEAYITDPVDFKKSLSGKPRVRIAYIKSSKALTNVTVRLKSSSGLEDVYFVHDYSSKSILAVSQYMELPQGMGVYSLIIREELKEIAFVKLYTMSKPNTVNILWQIPQYVLISVAEIMFGVAGMVSFSSRWQFFGDNHYSTEHVQKSDTTSNTATDNATNEREIKPKKLPYPKSVFFIVSNEFCERFCFYGMRSAIVSDSFLGKFRTILYVSMVYAAGCVLLALASVGPLHLPMTALSAVGLLLIAIGTGGIKPCVSAFGDQEDQMMTYFSWFYFSINAGSFISTFLTPVLRNDVHCFGQESCFPLAFGYAISQKLKSNEKKDHWLDYAEAKFGSQLVNNIKVTLKVLVLYIPLPIFWTLYDQQGSGWTFQAVRMDGNIGGKSTADIDIHSDLHVWGVPRACEMQIVDDATAKNDLAKTVAHMDVYTNKDVMFSGSNKLVTFKLTGSCLGQDLSFSGNITEKKAYGIYATESEGRLFEDFVDKNITFIQDSYSIIVKSGNYSLHKVPNPGDYSINGGPQKATFKLGGTYTILIGKENGALNSTEVVVTQPNDIHILWLMPQYIIITAAEIMFSITGLEFSYSQAPISMKSLLQACFLLTTAIGNLIIVIIESVKFFDKQSNDFFLYTALMVVDMGLFGFLAMRYKYVIPEDSEAEELQEDVEKSSNGIENPSFKTTDGNKVDSLQN